MKKLICTMRFMVLFFCGNIMKMKKEIFFTIICLMLNSAAFSQSEWFFQNHITNSPGLNSVYFIDNNTGWAVGDASMVLKTTNGGRNWVSQPSVLGNLYSVYFTNSNTGWIVGGGKIYKTTNKGINWIGSQPILTENNSFFSVFFINNDTGWVGGFARLIKTTNGGTTWTEHNYGGTTLNCSIYFIEENTGWVVDGSSEIFKTINGGTNWISQPSGINTHLSSIFFINNNTGWAVGFEGAIIKTTNGGSNWIDQSDGNSTSLISVYFVNNNTGWTVGGSLGTILKTTNSGVNWISQDVGYSGGLRSVFFINDYLGWAVGRNTTILSTSPNDVGITSIIEPTPGSANYADCISGKTIIPKTLIKNYGVNNQYTLFDVHFEINHGNSVIYSDVKQDTISSGQSHTIIFNPYNLPVNSTGDVDTYTVTSWTSLSTDLNNTNDTMHSIFTVSNFNYGYSDISNYYFLNSSTEASCIPDQPVYNWEDTTGSTSFYYYGMLKVPFTIGNQSNGCFLLPDVFPDGNKFRFFGTTYDTITISTNGIIGLGSSLNGMLNQSPVPLPSPTAAAPAIFPFWFGFDQQNGDLFFMNIQYKVSGNKFIITYDRIPAGGTTNRDSEYVSYQVILETAIDGGTENGNIIVQFDTSKCGSVFLNKYFSGNLDTNTVGIQNSTGTVGIQYRYANSSGVHITPGPLFGSPLAIRFGQINNVLPVELESFTSFVNENNVNLIWRVASEINNSGYDIERSNVKGKTSNEWLKIGSVAGKGSTTNTQQYSFTDKNLSSGKYKYRLKQIDFNGNFEYFELTNEVNIGIPVRFNLSQNYPNPFNPVTTINYDLPNDGIVTIKVYDIIGREVKTFVSEMKTAGYYKLQFNVSDFASGAYFYRMNAGDFVAVKKFVVLK